jgi:methylenetetrahydrofolate reductase (NADPH)
MRIDEILEHRRPVFSFEFFPPRTGEGERTLGLALGQLQDDRPDFVSMTYGAGGATRNATVELTKWIKQDLGIEAMAHLSCVGEPTERLIEILEGIQEAGIDNVLALRGDPPRGETEWRAHPGDPADRRALRLLRRRRVLPRGASRRARPRHRPALRP